MPPLSWRLSQSSNYRMVSERPRLWKAKATRRQRQVKVQRYVGLHRTKHPREKPYDAVGRKCRGKILKRFSVLPVLLWDKRLHVIRPQVIMELADMHESLVRFPAIMLVSATRPTNLERQSRTSIAATSMS